MLIAEVITHLESIADPVLQEQYDNAGLLTGNSSWECKGILCALDTTEAVVEEAITRKCNLIVAHHPIIFSGLKKINGKNYVEKTIIAAIKNDIAIYAIHTNLDNVIGGVNGRIASMLGLRSVRILAPKSNLLRKLVTYAPVDHAEKVRNALFAAGAGHIGNYSECSFNAEGTGTFKPGPGTNPFAGNIGEQHQDKETRIEVICPTWLESALLKAMRDAHPYEEVAYDLVPLTNSHQEVGSGVVGELAQPVSEVAFLGRLKEVFGTALIRHSALVGRQVSRVAICGGSGSFLIPKALAAQADFYVTADMKYHEFFDANDRLVIADIGHYESEQFTISLLAELLEEKFPTFAVLKTVVNTNPVQYY